MSEDLSIGLIADSHYPRLGGMEHENHRLASAFQKLPKTRIAVACSTMPEVPRDFFYPYPVYRHHSLSILTPWLSARSTGRMVGNMGINILHGAMVHGGGYRAVELGRRLGLPVAVRAHGADLQTVAEIGYGALLDPALARRVRHALKHADFVSVPCTRLRQVAIRAGADAEKIEVVPPGIDFAALDRTPFEDMRARYGIAPDDFLILTVGRNRPIKRLDLLFDALRVLAAAHPTLRCLCVGPREDLPDLVRRYGLEKVVLPLGSIRPSPAKGQDTAAPPAELVNVYRAADAYVATSYFESFGLAALDALACGTPVVVTRGQGVEDVIAPDRNGYVVEDATSAGVAAAIGRLIAAKPTRDRTRIRASIAHLTWDRAAMQLSETYRDLVGHRPRKRQDLPQ